MQVHGSVDHLIMVGSVVVDAAGLAGPGGVAECFTDGGAIQRAARLAVAAGKPVAVEAPGRAPWPGWLLGTGDNGHA